MGTLIRLNNVTLGYNHLFEKHAPVGSDRAMYSAELVLPPGHPDIAKIQQVFRQVATEAGKGQYLQHLISPLKDGNAINTERQGKGKAPMDHYAGNFIIKANDRDVAPRVVDGNRNPILANQRDQIFGGCLVNAFIDLYWSNNQQNPGVFCGLLGIQLVSNVNVTPIGREQMSPEQMFDTVEGAPAPLQQPAMQPQGPAQQPQPNTKAPWE
jgi:hypothetical protein